MVLGRIGDGQNFEFLFTLRFVNFGLEYLNLPRNANANISHILQEVAENIADTGHFAKLHETSYFAKLNFNNRMMDFIFDQEWKTGWYVSKEENKGHESFMEASIIHKIFKQTVLDTSFLGRSVNT